jgi:hypothetical protein
MLEVLFCGVVVGVGTGVVGKMVADGGGEDALLEDVNLRSLTKVSGGSTRGARGGGE